MGYLDDDGFLYITGRIKEQYKLENGKYVVPTPLEEQLKLSPFIANAMVYGDNKPFNVALVVRQPRRGEEMRARAGPRNAGARSAPREPEGARALQEGDREVLRRVQGLRSGARTSPLIAEDFTTDNGMLTPSLKVKRRKVMEKYGKTVDALYSKKRERPQASAQAN